MRANRCLTSGNLLEAQSVGSSDDTGGLASDKEVLALTGYIPSLRICRFYCGGG
jgi:hypothetical protein